jgi:DNA-binding SARP family transcriptional activator
VIRTESDYFEEKLTLSILGEFQLQDDRGTIILDDGDGRKTALLKYLACNADSPRSMKDVADALWPQSGDASAQGNLRVALYKLKTQLRSAGYQLPVKSCPGGRVMLDRSALIVDAWEAEKAAESVLRDDDCAIDEVARVLAKLNIDLLPGDIYVDWSTTYRTRLESLRRDLLLHALERMQSEPVNIKIARQIDRLAYDFIESDPSDMEVTPEFVRYLVARNRCTEANEICRLFLQHDGDVELLPQVRSMEVAPASAPLLSADPRVSWTPRSDVNLDECSLEVAALGDALDLSFDGVGQVVVLSSRDQRMRTGIAEYIVCEAEDRGALICDITHDDAPFIASCAFAMERLCTAIHFDKAQLGAVDAEFTSLLEHCAHLRAGDASGKVGNDLPYRLTAAIRAIAKYATLVISIDQAELLDPHGADFLAQLLLLARWYPIFVLVRMDLDPRSSTAAAHLMDAIRGSVRFITIDSDADSAPSFLLEAVGA